MDETILFPKIIDYKFGEDKNRCFVEALENERNYFPRREFHLPENIMEKKKKSNNSLNLEEANNSVYYNEPQKELHSEENSYENEEEEEEENENIEKINEEPNNVNGEYIYRVDSDDSTNLLMFFAILIIIFKIS